MAEALQEEFEFFQRYKHEKGFRMPSAHWHTHHELYYLVSGETKYFIGSELYVLRAGDLIWIPKEEYHRTEYGEQGGTERILLIFNEDFLPSSYQPYLAELNACRHLHVPKEKQAALQSLFRKMEEESTERPRDYRKMQRLLLQQLLLYLARWKQEIHQQELQGNEQRIQEAARYINSHCQQELTLPQLAQQNAMSPGHFSKLFTRITGVGPKEYINISRITMAQNLFSLGSTNVTQVALQCGFSDSNYFARVFKQITGMTPRQYIRLQKE